MCINIRVHTVRVLPVRCQEVFLTFFEAIKELRSRTGWNRDTLALKAGVTFQAVSSWEQGRRRPSRKTCERLGRLAMELDYNDLASLFFAWAGLFQPPFSGSLEMEVKLVKPKVARYRNTIRMAADELARRAGRGDGAAEELLKNFAAQMLQRAGLEEKKNNEEPGVDDVCPNIRNKPVRSRQERG